MGGGGGGGGREQEEEEDRQEVEDEEAQDLEGFHPDANGCCDRGRGGGWWWWPAVIHCQQRGVIVIVIAIGRSGGSWFMIHHALSTFHGAFSSFHGKRWPASEARCEMPPPPRSHHVPFSLPFFLFVAFLVFEFFIFGL